LGRDVVLLAAFFFERFGREKRLSRVYKVTEQRVSLTVYNDNFALVKDRRLLEEALALPKGKCRVYKADRDKSLEFIGEDTIEHTARDEKVTLYIGDAFDIVGERKQTDFAKVTDHVYEEAFEIKVRNHKETPVTVKVLEKLYR
jgi:hypothetical protein